MNTSVLNPTVISPTAVLAIDVSFSDDALLVRLSDGREISVPLEWFPRLRDATPTQRAHWRLIARGIGIHWEEVDEDIAVTTLLRAGWINIERASEPRKRLRRKKKVESVQSKRPPNQRVPRTATRATVPPSHKSRRARGG